MPGHSVRATRALQRLAETDPAFASLALWVDHVDSDARLLPAWSTATTVHYGPNFETFSLDEQVGLCGHHILHIAFRHASRGAEMKVRYGADHDDPLFNLASDAVLNEAVFRSGYILPRPCVLLSEVLRDVLSAPLPVDQALATWDTEKLYVRLMASRGKGSGGEDRRRAHAYAAERGFEPDLAGGEALEETPDDPGEWRQRIARAMEAGRLAGRGIGTIGYRLADLPEARTPWETLLRSLVTKAVTEAPRHSWRRPTGRWLALDAAGETTPFEPTLVRDARAPRVAVALDSSGSIDDARLSLFAAQVAGIARRTGAETHVLVFDDGVRAHKVMRAGTWERAISPLDVSRDGGTDYTEVMRAADALEPAVIVVLTDLDAEMPPRPRAPVIWAVPEDDAPAPPYGRRISLAR
jgi:predicted metal-dependent peptidase